MKERKLEPAQARAAYTLDRHISVTAGPGAGKTTVLVERYLHILREQKPASIRSDSCHDFYQSRSQRDARTFAQSVG